MLRFLFLRCDFAIVVAFVVGVCARALLPHKKLKKPHMGDNGCECSAKTAIERVCASLGVWSFLFFFLLFDISIILELWIKKPDIDTDTGLYRLLLATGDWRLGHVVPAMVVVCVCI